MPPPRLRRTILLTLAVAAGCSDAAAPGAASADRTFVLVDDTTFRAEPFTRIIGAVRLEAGGLIVADLVEGGLIHVDGEGVRGAPFGNRGEGPGEFMDIAGILPLASDAFAIVDTRLQRLTFFTGSGESIEQRALPTELRSGPWRIAGHRLVARAPIDLSQDAADTPLPLLAWDWESGAIDTLTAVSRRPVHMISVDPGQPQFVVGFPEPYASEDAWVTTSDGQVIVLRAEPYAVERIEGSSAIVGPTLTFPSVPVTAADRASLEAAAPGSDRWPWPVAKPPFRPDGAMATTEGEEIWIRTWQTDAEGEWYDRLSAEGHRIGRILFPEDRRLLLAVGEEELYTVEVDDLGFEWLRRGRLTPITP